MAYVREEILEMFRNIDYYVPFPSKLDYFIEQLKKKKNIIIKGNGVCTCTYCKTTFPSKVKVKPSSPRKEVKCPNCKNKFKLYRSNIQSVEEIDTFVVLNIIDSKKVYRYFQFQSFYSNSQGFNYHYQEYARIVEDEIFLHQNCQFNMGGYLSVYKNYKASKFEWRKYVPYNYYGYYGVSGSFDLKAIVYPYNLNQVLYDTKYRYCELSTYFENKIGEEINPKYFFDRTTPNVEYLIKLKLYNLVNSNLGYYPTKTFYQNFGVDKTYYEFMKKHNINFKELQCLKLLKEKNIRKIRYFAKNIYINNMEEINNYAKINYSELIKYVKRRRKFDTRMYSDYLRMSSRLGINLKNKKYLYPKYLKKEHDKVMEEYENNKSQLLRKKIVQKYHYLKKNVYKDKKYIIFPAPSIRALNRESKRLEHCVRTYAEDIADNRCDIYFMRELKNVRKPLVTVEVVNKDILQSRGFSNRTVLGEEKAFLRKWEMTTLKEIESNNAVKIAA